MASAMNRELKLFFFVVAAKIVLLAAVLLVFGESRLIWSDSATYIAIGRNIFEGHGFSTTDTDRVIFTPNSIRTPLYPFIVGLFETYIPHGLVVVSFLQAVAAGFIALLVYKLGLLFFSPKWALLTALAVSFEPLISSIHILILPETFLVLFLLIFIFFFLRYFTEQYAKNLYISAVALALAVYVKPVALYLFFVPCIFLLFQKRGVVKMFLFLVILFVLLAPWMARNKAVVGTFDMTTDDTGNLCGWEMVGILAAKYRIDSSDFTTLYALPEYATAKSKCTSTVFALTMFLTEYPSHFLKTSILSAAALLTNDGYSGAFFKKPPDQQTKIHHNYLTPAVFTNTDWRAKISAAAGELTVVELAVVIAGKVFWTFIAIMSVFGAMRLVFIEKSSLAVFLLLVVLYFITVTVTSTGFGVGARLRYPIDPLLLLFAVYRLRNIQSLRAYGGYSQKT